MTKNNFISEDKKTINLPVALGTTVYETHSTCGDFCLFQKEKFNKEFPPTEEGRCNTFMPCHTRKFATKPVIVSLRNIEWILDDWGVRYFETFEEAEKVSEKRVMEHIEKMKELGFEIRDDGYSVVHKKEK